MAPTEQDKVLSYGDYILREFDVALLKGKDWLNDTLIGFYFEYLSNSALKSEQFDKQTGDKDNSERRGCQFVGPEVTQLLKLISKEEVSIVLEAVIQGMDSKDFTLFPVNDSNSKIHNGHVGGSHWSLLIYSKADKAFVHFDSVQKANDSDAKLIVSKLSSFTAAAPFSNHPSCGRQENGYDCGCHVLRNAELISEFVAGRGTSIMCTSCPTSSPEEAAEMRPKLVALINKLKESNRDS